jgi:hypothetical protein
VTLRRVLPTRRQWQSWTLPSQYSAVSVVLGGVGVVIGLASLWGMFWPRNLPDPRKPLTAEEAREVAQQLAIAQRQIQVDDFFDRDLPGLSAHLVTALRPVDAQRRHCH